MKLILNVKVEGWKEKPSWGLCKESYSKEVSKNSSGTALFEELSEIMKRYSTIFRVEFSAGRQEEPIPCKGEISQKLIREAEEEARKKREEDANKS